ncbi:MAG: ABC transporter ATP-binding protein [Actinomycetota bacterium]|nr:ABC transporter ATP-binding protein [Actinomycetota bacterium]
MSAAPGGREPAIAVSGLSKRFRVYRERNQSLKAAVLRGGRARYEEFWALRDVSLEVPVGATYGLIGQNGSGKSTLLKCMARILRPDEGRLAVTGKVSALLELGAGFHPELSGRENVFLNGSILGLAKRELAERFDEIVDFAGLEQFIDAPVKNYSSGMYVRLGFSIAINVDPDVLLVDEVLAVGDESFQQRCAVKFDELRDAGKTIVIVSHSMDSVRRLCDSAVWLDGGVVKGTGRPGDLIDEYVGGTHAERATVETGGSRWGTGEAQIDEVELLGAGGRTASVRTGDTVMIRLHYTAPTTLTKPVFAIELYNVGGVQVTAPNTYDANLVPDRLSGSGTVDLQVDRLLLAPGVFDISAKLSDLYGVHVYDYRHRALRFSVEPGQPREQAGVMSLGGGWSMHPRQSLAGEPA